MDSSSEKEDEFKCPWTDCGAAFRRKDHLTRHIRSHNDERPYPCPIDGCKASFRTSWHLKRHVKRVHEEPHRCDTCGKQFTKKAGLRRHTVLEHGENHPYQCHHQECGTGFFSPQALNDHLALHDNPPYVCSSEGCNEGFLKAKQLRKHIRTAHPIFCNVCGLPVKSEAQLIEHKKTHKVPVDERKKYKCPFVGCSRSYTKQANLNAHVRASHECLRFSCTVESCDKTYAHKKSLIAHIERDHSDLSDSTLEYYVKAAYSTSENDTAELFGSHKRRRLQSCAENDSSAPMQSYSQPMGTNK